tara:strand:+ start:342 stop:1559 length:1218 start_codon:yes stop_codon:yes gene_type:complete
MRLFLSISVILFFNVAIIAQDSIKITYYNLLDFPAAQQDRIDTLKKVLDYVNPDIFVVNELTSFNGAALIKNNALNTNGVNRFSSAVFYDGPDTDNMLFYDHDKFTLYSQQQIVTTLRDISEYVLYYNEADLATTNDTIFLYLYSLHLKAGSETSNVNWRDQDAVILKNFLVNNNRNSRLIVGGDFNFYNHTESGCQEILYGQGLQLKDPINRMGNWHTNVGYKNYHTQSTRAGTVGYAGGAHGGMDDRFDFIFVSEDILSGNDGVMYVENTYVAEGQDGNHYNQSINNGTNTAVSADIANALYYMSDHLPVSMTIMLGGTVGYNVLNTDNIKIIYQVQNKVLELKNLSTHGLISVFDMSGSCLKQIKIKGQNSSTLDLSNLDSGMYIAHLVLENNSISYKFVIH